MVKVVVSDSKGLVQSTGSGVEIESSTTISNLSSTSMTAVGRLGVPLTLKSKRQVVAVTAATSTATTGNFIPAGAQVVAAAIAIVTAEDATNGSACTISDFGIVGDADLFNVAPTNTLACANASVAIMGLVDPNQTAAGGTHPGGYFGANTEAQITYNNPGASDVKPTVSITIWYYDLSAVSGI
tara:strand:- start:1136 stop:1687 length:552 start_codon:yes stop_codon:yes gene_type:complete